MNFIKKMYIKYLVSKAFRDEFVKGGFVNPDFKVVWDKEKQDFLVCYTPLNVKNLDDIEEDAVLEEDPLKFDVDV